MLDFNNSNSRNSLVNIEKIEGNLWTGLIIGFAVGYFIHWVNEKEKQE
jgi:hypothetical protein